jgi:hypothetical protein
VHPENLTDTKSLKITDELKGFVTELSSDVDTEKANRSQWEQNVDKGINLRYGVRQPKTTPWVGCANYVVPLIDTHINNNKVAYINLVNIDPICTFIPFSGESIEPARLKELVFDWRMKNKVKFFEPYNEGVDIALEQGIVIWKIIWKFTTEEYNEHIDLSDFDEQTLGALFDERVTDQVLMKILEEEYGIDMSFEENYQAVLKAVKKFREGATEFDIDLVEIRDNQPEVIPLSLREDVVMPIGTTDIQQARFIDHRFYKSINEVKIAMRDEKYEEYDSSTIKAWAGKQMPYTKRSKSTTTVDDDQVLLHETCCWYSPDGEEGIARRYIVTYPDADPSCVLRFIEVPYDHGHFPYVRCKREMNDRGLYSSRGYPWLDEDYQTGISTALNQAIDNGTIVNTPKVVYKRNSVSNIKNARYTPAEPVEIISGQTTDYEIRQVGNLSQGILFQQAQFLKAWADNRVGNIQAGFTDPTNMAGSGQQGQKSATEAQLMASLQGQVQSLDLLVWQNQMAEVYYQVDALYDQFGDDSEEVILYGRPIKVNRRETQGRFSIMPNGRLENTNPMMRAMKTMNLMRVFAGDPDIKQTELKKLYLMDYDARIAKRIMLSDEEIQQRDQMQKQMQQQVKAQMQSDAVSAKQIENLLEVDKEMNLSKIPRREIVVDYNNDDDGESKSRSANRKSVVKYG